MHHIYDVSGEEPVFIGIISNATKVPYKTTPGEHTFMVVSEAADFLHADLSAGKTYYSLVTPRMGAWKARFSLWPIRNDSNADYSLKSSDFQSWNNGTKTAELTDKARQWFESNKGSVMSKQSKYWPVWQQKDKSDLERRTLNPEDGI